MNACCALNALRTGLGRTVLLAIMFLVTAGFTPPSTSKPTPANPPTGSSCGYTAAAFEIENGAEPEFGTKDAAGNCEGAPRHRC